MKTALRVEFLKFRSAPIVWITSVVVMVVVPLASVGSYAVARLAPGTPAAAKAEAMLQGAGWEAVFGLAAQAGSVAIAGGAGIVLSWCFGREFTEKTVVGLFALPISRVAIAGAKVVVVFGWVLVVSLLVSLAVLFGGVFVRLSPQEGLGLTGKFLLMCLLGSVAMLPAAWVASWGRGYLAGIGAVIGITIVSQFTAAFGGGAWVPWVIPALWAGAVGPVAASQISFAQLLLPLAVGVLGAGALLGWWGRAQLGDSRG